jgi:hypothetical protein
MDKIVYFVCDRNNVNDISIFSEHHLANIKNALKLTSFSYNELSKYTHLLTHMGYKVIYVPDYANGVEKPLIPRSSL